MEFRKRDNFSTLSYRKNNLLQQRWLTKGNVIEKVDKDMGMKVKDEMCVERDTIVNLKFTCGRRNKTNVRIELFRVLEFIKNF